MKCFEKFKLQKNCNQSCSSRIFLRLVEMTLRPEHSKYSLPECPGGVLGISSDGDDGMKPKVKTQKNP